jgi:AraC-like DNA-binding protein
VSRREYGSIVFANVQHDPISGTRHIADINRRDDQVIGLTLFGKGAMTFSQGGLELLIQSHELLLWDGTRPGSLQSWEPVECKTILFPRNLVCQHIGDVDDLTGRKIGIDTGTGLLLNSHIETLHQSVGLIAPRDMSTVLRATLGMVGACFRPLDATPTGTAYHKNLFRRVEELMRETLLEPTFSATMVAASFGFSPRALHRLFAEAGTTFSVWVRKERLARAERALASPGLTAESITQIAHRFGFCDAAHFSNSFKVQYGASPKAYRLAARELK